MKLILINIAIALIGTGIAGYWDYKTGIVPDKLSHLMIIAGAIMVPFVYPDFIPVYGLAAAVFGIGFILYSLGQLGGGDVKLFTALALLLPYYPSYLSSIVSTVGINPAIPIYPFVGSLFLLAGIIGPMFLGSIKYHRKIRSRKESIDEFKSKNRKGILLVMVLAPLAVFWSYMSLGFLLLFIPMGLTLYLIPFKDDIIQLFYSTEKEVDELDDDDVLALEDIEEEKKEDLGLWRKTFTSRELDSIKQKANEESYDNIQVCEDLPRFVPYIFVSLTLNLIFGDVFLYLLKLFMI